MLEAPPPVGGRLPSTPAPSRGQAAGKPRGLMAARRYLRRRPRRPLRRGALCARRGQHALDTVVGEMETPGPPDRRQRRFPPPAGSPLIDVNQARRAALAVLEHEGFGKPVQDFVGVVAANRRLRALREIVAAFAALVAEKRGIVTAHVASAHPLSDVQRQQLRARLIEAGYGNVNIARDGRPDLLGGLVVQHRRPAVRHQPEIPPAAPAVRHEGSRLIWRSAQPRSRRS